MKQRERAVWRRRWLALGAAYSRLATRVVFTGRAGGGTAEVGRLGERRTAWLYRLLGFRIVGRNLSIGGGEIDLIATRGSLVVFVEVKTRTSDFSAGWEAVDASKREQLLKLSSLWLVRNRGYEDVRFDVVSIQWSGDRAVVDRFVDAFRDD